MAGAAPLQSLGIQPLGRWVPRGAKQGFKGVRRCHQGVRKRDTLKSGPLQRIGRKVSKGSGRVQWVHWVSQGFKTTPPLVAPFRPRPPHTGYLNIMFRCAPLGCVIDADTLRRQSLCWRLWRLRKPLDPPRAADHGDFRGEGAAAGLSTARAAGARADGGSLA